MTQGGSSDGYFYRTWRYVYLKRVRSVNVVPISQRLRLHWQLRRGSDSISKTGQYQTVGSDPTSVEGTAVVPREEWYGPTSSHIEGRPFLIIRSLLSLSSGLGPARDYI